MDKIEIDITEHVRMLKGILMVIGALSLIIVIGLLVFHSGQLSTAPPTAPIQPAVPVAPVQTPLPLPQVIEVTIAQTTFSNGRYESDTTSGQPLYFPSYDSLQSVQPGGIYLIQPVSIDGTGYDVDGVVTTIQQPSYQHIDYGDGYVSSAWWDSNVIYHSSDRHGNHYYRYDRGVGLHEVPYTDSIGHKIQEVPR